MRTIIFIFIGIFLLAALFVIFKPKAPQQVLTKNQSTTYLTPTVTPGPKTFTLLIENGQLSKGEETMHVTEGERVVIKTIADGEDELHLHGYDVFVDLVPAEERELSFTADMTGRFIVELEHAHSEIAAVEVSPK